MSNTINLKYVKWQPCHVSGPVPLVYQLVQQHVANNCDTVLPQHPWLHSELLINTVAYESKPY
jgi:hypothetical protein